MKSTTAVVKPPPARTARGVPAELVEVVTSLYFGGAIRSSPAAGKVLDKPEPVTAAGSVVVTGAVGVCKGVPIAVVTRGKDASLAVRAPRWTVGGYWPSVGLSAPSLGRGPRRVLMVGSDARPGQLLDRSRGVSLHIVGFDDHGGGGVLGIPWDCNAPLATAGQGKSNSALALGGPLPMQRTVVAATGVPLEGYIFTGFDGFQTLVVGIGGLPLKAPGAVKDKVSGANLRAGANKLSGGQALAYQRVRHTVAGGDFGRLADQGLLILASAGFARHVGPGKLPGIAPKGAASIQTNLSGAHSETRGRRLCHLAEQGEQPGRDRRLRVDRARSVDLPSRRQGPASLCRHQGRQLVVIGALSWVAPMSTGQALLS